MYLALINPQSSDFSPHTLEHYGAQASTDAQIGSQMRVYLVIALSLSVVHAMQPQLPGKVRQRSYRTMMPVMQASDEATADKPLKLLPAVAGVGTLGVCLLHAPAYAQFASQWQQIAASGISGDDLWAPFQFWLFFAAMHPLLQPALWISEVLHGSPGPQIADIMPITFLFGNVAVIGGLFALPRARTALNIALVGLFINYIGCGLEGTGGLGDYNLALDDGVRGCPTYSEVRQTSMSDFDKTKYTGRWYEHAFHDYTQFSDTYDVTLDIELSADKQRWLDDFGLRGPAPLAAPLSWDKSPVANGAHYFLYGKFEDATPGVLQESGFGVTFPNFIVDVQKGDDGSYQEAIQFQCLERGGVRIFEGINFLSRSPTMSDASMQAMLQRAKAAGMAPYGATAEQMHVVPHYPVDAPPVDNAWQRLWATIGFDKLLALLEESSHSSFEDTSLGRDVSNLRE